MNRRNFITKTTASSALLGLGGLSMGSCSSRQRHITILHTNDVHSHIEPFPKSHSDYPDLGGVARRAALVRRIREENPNTLLFDAGDIFQGTPYFNFYGGELEFKLMSLLRYDAATIGNHDFDNGIEGLFTQLPNARFQLLSSNYDFSNTLMDGLVKPFSVYAVDGINVGVYGLGIKLEGLVNQKHYKETLYLDPYETALDSERILKEDEHCDLIVCLSHLGYKYKNENRPSDVKLAASTRHTDLVIGGHTHTFLEKPTVVKNRSDKEVLVNQVGCFGINLGRVDFYWDAARNKNGNGVTLTI
ncbi:metallophosphatase [Ulvibacterium sp.]|uniref:metallophosphatase n=1 Tax=Ulvibacterium sp. TaxID=2665914 RepID=UPI002627A4D2|nr:metallophosphatase [Ulvibacterium sp.]